MFGGDLTPQTLVKLLLQLSLWCVEKMPLENKNIAFN